MTRPCGKALIGHAWHVHHCVKDDDAIHGPSHACSCGHTWSNEEQLTLTPFLNTWAEAG